MVWCLLEEEDVGRLEEGQRRAIGMAGGTDLLCWDRSHRDRGISILGILRKRI